MVSTLSYAYNGHSARLVQIGDGLRTDYEQDVAGPLAQVLAATEGEGWLLAENLELSEG